MGRETNAGFLSVVACMYVQCVMAVIAESAVAVRRPVRSIVLLQPAQVEVSRTEPHP